MGVFKYKIRFKYVEEGADPIEIPYDNLDNMIIDYDYKSETHFPIVMAIFRMDKNLIDKIIEHKDTAKMIFSIKKMNERDENALEENYITDAECYYTIQDDVNKDEKKDYEEKTADGGDKKDVYKQVTIGLSGVKFVEDNVKSTNLTVKDTNMMGVVHEVTKHMKMCIEPFKYNEDIPQLLIPPQESVNETLKFLNDLKVFYDSPYRFYMEFDRGFLVSSSATPVEMKGEKYATVIIEVRDNKDKDTHDAYEQGISENDEAQAYMIGIQKESTQFSQDNTTSKEFNKLVGILDPSKQNSIPNLTNDFLSGINSMMDTMRSTVNNTVNNVSSGINDAVSGFNRMNFNLKEIVEEQVQAFESTVSEASSYVDGLISQVRQVEQKLQEVGQSAGNMGSDIEGAVGGGFGGAIGQGTNPLAGIDFNADEIINKIREYQTKLQESGPKCDGCFGDLGKGVETFGEYSNKSCDVGYNVTNINGSINGIKIQNAADNIEHMCKDYDEKNKKDIADMITTCDKANDEVTTSSDGINESMDDATSSIDGIKEEMMKVQAAADAANSAGSGDSGGGSDSSSSSGSEGGSDPVEVDFSMLDTYKSDILGQKSTCAPSFQEMKDKCDMGKQTSALMDKVNNKVTEKVNEMKDMKSKLENQFKDISNSWKEAANNLQSQVKQMEAMGKMGIGSISDLKDLNKIADLSSVAKLGVTSISTPQLNIMTTGSEKVKFVKLGNDDPNKIKNIQAEIEMMGTMFTITKEHMDNSLLTINKKYLVQNKGQHTDENGKYLLIRKREVYMKEDQKFSTTTMLSFCRVGES